MRAGMALWGPLLAAGAGWLALTLARRPPSGAAGGKN
jgi:hypothetical protein